MEEAVIKRIMPHNTEAEQSVLGAMFMSRDAIMVATDILTGEDFYQQQYGAMFTAMAELYAEGQPVDLLNPPAGCPFAPRCANCMKICLSQMPPRTELSDTHYSYCWLLQKEAFEEGDGSCE